MTLSDRLPDELAFLTRKAEEADAYIPLHEEPNCLRGGGCHGSVLWIEAGYDQPVCALCRQGVGLACIVYEG